MRDLEHQDGCSWRVMTAIWVIIASATTIGWANERRRHNEDLAASRTYADKLDEALDQHREFIRGLEAQRIKDGGRP